jgi:hypothetical protein
MVVGYGSNLLDLSDAFGTKAYPFTWVFNTLMLRSIACGLWTEIDDFQINQILTFTQ